MAVKLSVIIPVYNKEPYLRECLDSVLKQDVDEMEIICVDDGSTDASGTILDQYATKDDRVHVIRQTNQGAMRARKSGMQIATGKYVTFMDGDDYLDDGLYHDLLRNAEAHNADVVIYSFIHENDETSVYKPNQIRSGLYENESLLPFYGEMMNRKPFYTFTVWPNQVNKLFLREIVSDIQMSAPDEITVGDDAAVSFPALLRADRIYVNNDLNGYHYRMVEASITHRPDERYYYRVSVLYGYLKKVFMSQSEDVRQRLMPQLERYRVYLIRDILSLRDRLLLLEPRLTEEEIKERTVSMTAGATIFDGLERTSIPGVSDGTKKRIVMAAKGNWRALERSMKLASVKKRIYHTFRRQPDI